MLNFNSLLSLFGSLLERVNKAQKQEITLKYQSIFGIAGIIFYFQPYIYWIAESHYTHSISILKTLGTWICVLFFCALNGFKEFEHKEYVISFAWYTMICYCLPFVSTACLLISGFDTFWQMNSIFCNLVLSLMTGWYSFISVNFIGSLMGYFAYCLITNNAKIFFLLNDGDLLVYNYALTIFICYVLIYVKDANIILLNNVKDKLSSINNHLQNKINKRTRHLRSSLLAKEKFLNNISHEMRTPMQGIYGIAQDLKDGWSEMEDARKLQYLQLIIKSSERLISLFCNLLDLGKLSASQMTMNFENADLQKVVSEVVLEFENLNSKSIPIIFKPNKELNFATKLDKVRIAQVVRNLISNAIKYSNNGVVEVGIEFDSSHEKNLVVSVKDTGIGIPANELNIIFLPFVQSTRTKTNTGGTGLGLSICAEIINLHQGKIWASSNSDKGSCFFFSLPFVESKEKIVSSIVRKINALGNVMILDDEQIAIESGTIILSSVGFKNILSAMDCKTCLEIIDANKISILFLDMMLPDMSGLEFLKILRQNPKFDHIKVIICSGMCDTKDVQEAIKSGALAHFSKPYSKSQILDGLSRLFVDLALER